MIGCLKANEVMLHNDIPYTSLDANDVLTTRQTHDAISGLKNTVRGDMQDFDTFGEVSTFFSSVDQSVVSSMVLEHNRARYTHDEQEAKLRSLCSDANHETLQGTESTKMLHLSTQQVHRIEGRDNKYAMNTVISDNNATYLNDLVDLDSKISRIDFDYVSFSNENRTKLATLNSQNNYSMLTLQEASDVLENTRDRGRLFMESGVGGIDSTVTATIGLLSVQENRNDSVLSTNLHMLEQRGVVASEDGGSLSDNVVTLSTLIDDQAFHAPLLSTMGSSLLQTTNDIRNDSLQSLHALTSAVSVTESIITHDSITTHARLNEVENAKSGQSIQALIESMQTLSNELFSFESRATQTLVDSVDASGDAVVKGSVVVVKGEIYLGPFWRIREQEDVLLIEFYDTGQHKWLPSTPHFRIEAMMQN